MKINKVKALLFFLLAGLAGIAVVFGKQDPVVIGETTNRDLQPVIQPDTTSQQVNFLTIEKIMEGQERLKKSPPLKFVEKTTKKRLRSGKTTTITEFVKKEIELSVLDTKTGEVFEKRYWLDEKEVEKANTIRKKYLENKENLPSFTPENPAETFQIITNWWNNFNSDLSIAEVAGPEEEKNRYAVIGNKFLLGNDNFAYFSEQTGDNYSDMIYAPYSRILHQPEFVEIGKNILNEWVATAFQKLRELKVMSKAFPEKLVVDTIQEEFVKNILLTEQTDPSMLLLADNKEKQKIIERVLVRIALNGERAYRYTFSKTEASGLGQIMPKTYSYVDPKTKKRKGTIQIYPEAKLIKDVNIGRIDVVNGIMASGLVFDSHLGDAFRNMTKKEKAKLDKKLISEPDFINEVRAAVYNGGASKYMPATATIFAGIKETVLFVKKYKMIRDLKLFAP
ncbi:MAG: hypothetical protein HYX21_01010 [Candidatus Yanofskybacteria bacterium]|nr:hypothetical protein [Candidatus Yanofskybacteria bacterium]